MSALDQHSQPFGRLLLAAPSGARIDDLEREHVQGGNFDRFDALFATLITRSLRGDRICRVTAGVGRQPVKVEMLGLQREQSEFVEDRFGYEQQRSRGAWYLKPDARLDLGLVNLGALLKAYPRFFWNTVLDETVKASLVSSSAAVLMWSFLGEAFRRLTEPLHLRGSGLAELSREEQVSAWESVEADLISLGLEPASTLGVLRYGAGWSRLSTVDQLAARQRYMSILGEQVDRSTVARLRALMTRPLVERYYVKAKTRGTALRRVVVAKSFEPVLSGVFGGDWLGFLAYIEEQVDSKERVATALEAPTLHVEAAPQARRLDAAESSDIGAASTPPGISERLECLERYWGQFDQLHGEQKHGMPPLSGLIPGRFLMLEPPHTRPEQDRDAFPSEFLDHAVRLWGSVVLPRWPDVIVSEPYPAARMVEAFGRALDVWDRIGRACWAASEWADEAALSELPTRLAEPMQQIADLGCPVDSSIFAELREAERHLAPAQKRVSSESRDPIGFGITVVMSVISGSSRAGFERLRDVSTRRRRAWAEQNLRRYLSARWRTELEAAITEFNRHKADRGKEPTVKQFVGRPVVSRALNNWLGGDINALYALAGLDGGQPQRTRLLLPMNRRAFAARVAERFGGLPVVRYDQYGAPIDRNDYYKRRQVEDLVQDSLRFVQLLELHETTPSLNDFGEEKIGRAASVLGVDANGLWTRYAAAVQRALTDSFRGSQ